MTAPNESTDQQLSTADLASASTPVQPEAATQPGDTQVETVPAATQASQASTEGPAPLFESSEVDAFRSRWTDVQASFVDDPRSAVQEADNLVASIMKRLAELFAEERQSLESQWEQGEDVSTEDLRVA